jgi:hypothetical protein
MYHPGGENGVFRFGIWIDRARLAFRKVVCHLTGRGVFVMIFTFQFDFPSLVSNTELLHVRKIIS